MTYTFQNAMDEMPLIAIVRGVQRSEVVPIAEALYNGGVRAIAVSLSSPNALASIQALAHSLADRAACGAGTIFDVEQVDHIRNFGGQFVTSPNIDAGVIKRTLKNRMQPLPGFGSMSEALTGYNLGARFLNLFPASTYGAAHLKALLDVVPPDSTIVPVGGVEPEDLKTWWDAGARAFAAGVEIYRPGLSPDDVYERATRFARSLTNARAGSA